VHVSASVLRVRLQKSPLCKSDALPPRYVTGTFSVGWGYMGRGPVVTVSSVWAVELAVVPARIAGHGGSSSRSVCCSLPLERVCRRLGLGGGVGSVPWIIQRCPIRLAFWYSHRSIMSPVSESCIIFFLRRCPLGKRRGYSGCVVG
jgi:hypothetical protein